jgi:spermidine synthase
MMMGSEHIGGYRLLAWETIDSAQVPGAATMLHLMRRGDEFAIWVDGRPLMTSREHGSEDALADLVCDRLSSSRYAPGPLTRAGKRPTPAKPAPAPLDPCILVGGLGMGFTLAAALRRLPADGCVEVAEIVPQVVEWNRGPIAHLAGFPLQDPRVIVHQADVAEVLRNLGCRAAPATIPRYDAILLDVDNGPKSLSTPANEWLYSPEGIRTAVASLRPSGFLAVWSAGPDPSFTSRLRRAGLQVEELAVRSRGSKGGHRHTVWLARLPL